MRKYFTHNGIYQEGPFTIDELKRKGITDKTKIWFENIDTWTEAGSVPELKGFIIATPPPYEKPGCTHQTFNKVKKTLRKNYTHKTENKSGDKILKISLIVLSITGLVFIINFTLPNEAREKSNPEKYLTIVDAKLKLNRPYYSDSKPYYTISGEIINAAKQTTYRDIRIKVEYFTTAKTIIEKKEYTIAQKFEPNKELDIVEIKSSFLRIPTAGTPFSFIVEPDPPPNADIRNIKYTIIDAALCTK